jgi:hypothetical protein
MRVFILTIAMLLSLVARVPAQEAVMSQLERYLASDSCSWDALARQSFADKALTASEAADAQRALVERRREELRAERAGEMQALEIVLGEFRMPFFFKTFGDKPAEGRSLFISLHGGGGAPKRVNDRQWNNQQRLYEPAEGVYVAPRAPTDTWNLWHEGHIMPLFDRLIEDMVLFEGVDPNRVYLMGYSAGGDGVYQLAPRMADRWAAAAMMAGHPNDAAPQNLRNIGFAIYVGGRDAAYHRNEVAAAWGDKLKALRDRDPGGYAHLVTIYPDKGHWMDGQDASALPWMANFARDPLAGKIVWRKDGHPQPRFYWLGADPDSWTGGELVTAEREGQTIHLAGFETIPPGLMIYANDQMLDLNQPVSLEWNQVTRTVQPRRTIATIHRSLTQRFDPRCVFSSEIPCRLPLSE